MLHQNSVFHGLLKQLPWHRFEQIVEKYSADDLSRRLSTKRHFIALLFGQLSGCTSLRDIVTGMASHETRLYHLGAAPVKLKLVFSAVGATTRISVTPICVPSGMRGTTWYFASVRRSGMSEPRIQP